MTKATIDFDKDASTVSLVSEDGTVIAKRSFEIGTTCIIGRPDYSQMVRIRSEFARLARKRGIEIISK
jgi:hypothetical protein